MKCQNQLVEIPFVEGMHSSIFSRVLRDLKLFDKKANIKQIIADSLLEISEDDKIYLQSAEDFFLLNEDESNAEETSDSEEQILQTAFIKFGGEILEVPFFNGIKFKDFWEILTFYGVIGDEKFLCKVIEESLLVIREGAIYFADEEKKFPDDFEEILEYLSDDTKKFIAENESNLKFINLTYKGYFFEVPFVNGMNCSVAAKILIEMDVADNFEDARKVLTANGFNILNGAVFLIE